MIATTADGARTWTVPALPPGVTALSSVSCTDRRRCVAGGQSGLVGTLLVTTDGGDAWTPATLPPGVTDISAVACRSDHRCTALAANSAQITALVSSLGSGTAWAATWPAAGPLPASLVSASGLACPDTQRCWATGAATPDTAHGVAAGARTTDGGATWTSINVPTAIGHLHSVWCGPAQPGSTSSVSSASATATLVCAAVGTTATITGAARTGRGVLAVTIDGGTTWEPVAVPASVADLRSVTCAAGPCVAVGTTVASLSRAGVAVLATQTGVSTSALRKTVAVPFALPLSGVACTDVSACTAVGQAVTYHLAPPD